MEFAHLTANHTLSRDQSTKTGNWHTERSEEASASTTDTVRMQQC